MTLLSLLLFPACGPACGDGTILKDGQCVVAEDTATTGGDTDTDTASDTDSDADSDTDTDADSDPDSDTDTDTDTGTARVTVCGSGGDFTSIQAAIDASTPGDRITICPGTYHESLIVSSDVTLVGLGDRDEVILDADGGATVLTVITAEGAVGLEHLTLTGGDDTYGAIDSARTSLSVTDCTIRDNTSAEATIQVEDGALDMTDVEISGNTAVFESAFYLSNSDATIIRARVHDNVATDPTSDGWGNVTLHSGGGTLDVFDSAFWGNTAVVALYSLDSEELFVVNSVFEVGVITEGSTAVGVAARYTSPASVGVENCVFYGDGGPESSGVSAPSGRYTIEYSDFWQVGSALCANLCEDASTIATAFEADPRFASSATGDFTLDAFSPCIDAGNPAAAYNDLDGTRNDVGVTGGPYAAP